MDFPHFDAYFYCFLKNIINYYVCLNHPQNWLGNPALFLGDSYANSILYPAH